MNLNKVFLIGNLTRDPELRTLPSGQPVASFGIATNRTWSDKNGQRQTAVEFHNVVAFGRLAEIIKQYCSKGKMIYVEGRLQTRNWEGQDGAKRSRTEVIVEAMQLGPRGGGTASSSEPSEAQQSNREQVETIEYPGDEGEINPDDIPF